MNPFDPSNSARQVIAASGVLAKKAFGQHFLQDENILRRIIAAANLSAVHHAIEIGPGPGVLTRLLLESPAETVTAVEIDPRCIEHLSLLQTLHPRLQLLNQDALKTDLLTLSSAPRVITANLPYNVATPLLAGWLQQIAAQGKNAFESMVLMFQKEVADRITAQPGNKDYGRISVLAQWLCRVEKLFDVAPSCFIPPPKVQSSVIRLTALETPRFHASLDALEKVVQAAFGQRRKMLRASLKTLVKDSEALLESAAIDGTRRAETLSVEEFCRLSEAFNHARSGGN